MFWDPIKQNHSTLDFGFKPELSPYTFDPYERAGSSIYYGIHDLLKFERRGYRKVTDHLTREIRHGRVGKSERSQLYDLYSNQKLDSGELKEFFDWLGVTDSGFDWFMKHKLLRSEKLIARQKSERIEISGLPKPLQEIVSIGHESTNQYQKFYKGIHIL